MSTTRLLVLLISLNGLVGVAVPVGGDDRHTPAASTGQTPLQPSGTSANSSIGSAWLRLPDMPESKEQFGLEACAGKIYAIAGIRHDGETSASFVYDTDRGVWSAIAPLPRAVQSVCLCAVKDRLFCIEGYNRGTKLKYPDTYLYDPSANTWLPRSPIPVAREDAGSAVIDGRIWIIGGLANPGHTLVPRIDIYDPDLDTWLPPRTLDPRYGKWPGRALGDFGCDYGNQLWCLGGAEDMNDYPLLHPCPWGLRTTDGADLGIIPIPDPRCYAVVKTMGDYLYVVGGCCTSTTDYAKTMLILHAPTRTWEDPVPLPYPARGQGACVCNGMLYVAGGYDGRTRTDFCLWLGHGAK